MDCAAITYSGHALRRLFERGLAPDAVRRAIEAGEIIADYPDDQPHPSVLLLGFVALKAVRRLADCIDDQPHPSVLLLGFVALKAVRRLADYPDDQPHPSVLLLGFVALKAVRRLADCIDDQPHPSVLLLGFVDGAAVHVVLARTPEGACIVITAYRPDPLLWSDDFRTRRTRP